MTLRYAIRLNKFETIEDYILDGIIKFINKNRSWEGTMTSLRTKLSRDLGENLPSSPAGLSRIINNITNRLRSRGISITKYRLNDELRTRQIKLEIK